MDFVRGRSPVLDKTVYSNTNWAPRIGFAFDVTGDGKTVLKGHYGQYYEAMLFDQYQRAMPGFTDFVGYDYDPGGDKCGPLGNCFSESLAPPLPALRGRPGHEAARGSTSGRPASSGRSPTTCASP